MADFRDDTLVAGFDEFARWCDPPGTERARLMGEPIRLVRVRADGALEDSSGGVHHDFISGYGTQAFGHRNAAITAAVRSYLDSDAPSFFPSGVSPYAGRVARLLAERTGYDSVALASSGTEAVESAFKLARVATGRTRVLSLEGAYHGMTMGSLSLTTAGPLRDPYGPHVPGVQALPFADVDALASALAAGDVAAVIVEPIQVEGGVRALPDAYVAALGELAQRHGALVIADEVQTGLSRTGPLLASARWGRRPDVVVLAKALGGGLVPLSAMLTSRNIFDRAYGDRAIDAHHYTFSGNGLACVAGIAAIGMLTDALAARVARVGDAFRRALHDALVGSPLVREVRGAGLLVGIELADIDHPWLGFDALGRADLQGRPTTGPLLCYRLFRRGYLTQVASLDWHVVRLQPPLEVGEDRLRDFVQVCQEEINVLGALT